MTKIKFMTSYQSLICLYMGEAAISQELSRNFSVEKGLNEESSRMLVYDDGFAKVRQAGGSLKCLLRGTF